MITTIKLHWFMVKFKDICGQQKTLINYSPKFFSQMLNFKSVVVNGRKNTHG